MDHQWVKNMNRISLEYIQGTKEFLEVARRSLNPNGVTLCPCLRCMNRRYRNIEVIRAHLINVGIDRSYTRWVHHGEEETDDEADALEEGLEGATDNHCPGSNPTDCLNENQQSAAENAHNEKSK